MGLLPGFNKLGDRQRCMADHPRSSTFVFLIVYVFCHAMPSCCRSPPCSPSPTSFTPSLLVIILYAVLVPATTKKLLLTIINIPQNPTATNLVLLSHVGTAVTFHAVLADCVHLSQKDQSSLLPPFIKAPILLSTLACAFHTREFHLADAKPRVKAHLFYKAGVRFKLPAAVV
jgi:hypothetical protein